MKSIFLPLLLSAGGLVNSASAATLWTTSFSKSASNSDISSVSLTQTGNVTGVTGSVTSLIAIDTMTGQPTTPGSNLALNTTVGADSWNQSFLPNAYIIAGTTANQAQGWQSVMNFTGTGHYLIDSLSLNMRDINIPTRELHSGGTGFTISLSILSSSGNVLGTATQAINFSNGHSTSLDFVISFASGINVNMEEGFNLQIKAYDGGNGQYKNLNLTQALGLKNITFNGAKAPDPIPEPTTGIMSLAALALLSLRRQR